MAEKKKKKEAESPKEAEPKIMTIPLRDAFTAPRKKRARKAVSIVKRYLLRHLKDDDIKISAKLNEALWARGIEKPPRKIRVKVTEEEGIRQADVLS